MKKFLAIALTAALLFNTQSLVYAEETTENGDEAATEYVSGYIQSDLDYNTPVYEDEVGLYSNVPSSYNTIAEVRSTYPENRNQNPYGTCWAFSSIGLAEFDLINDGAADNSIDLSELQLIYFLFNSATDPLGGTEGDSARYYNENASNIYLDYGGNYEMASRRLAQWVGAAKETDVPYSTASSVLNNGVSDAYAYNADVAHLQNAYLINIKQNPADVKQQIMEHGAVGVMYYHNSFNISYGPNGDDCNYYDTAVSGGGHAVMVVGWDDNYSKDNFLWNKPANDGAWLVRNSWGADTDYFWMSYETFSLSDTAWVFDFSADDGFDNNYQLDGGLDATANQQYTTMANVFTAKTDAEVKSETLKAVSVSFTHNASVNYTIEVYTDLTDVKNPTSGTKQESATTQGTTAYAGIYTIELADEVEIQPGSSFAIVVSVDKYALEYEQAMTIATGDNLEKIVWDCKVSMYNEKTFFKSGNRFYAYPWGNLCVKAFTSDNLKNSTPDVPIIPDTPEGSHRQEISEFVEGLYNNILGREAVASEVSTWTDVLQNNDKTAVEVSEKFIFGNEYESKNTSDEEYIKMLYCSILGREAQSVEIADMLKTMQYGVSRKYIFSLFVSSDEFVTKCNNIGIISGNVILTEARDQKVGITRFILRCYEKIIGRLPSVDELNIWCSQLINNNTSLAQVAVEGFFNSQEFKEKNVSESEFVRIMYQTFFDREPAEEDISYWGGEIRAGVSQNYIIHEITKSQEYADVCSWYGIENKSYDLTEYRDQNISITKFIVRCYDRIMKRSPSVEEINIWCSQLLDSNVSLAQVAVEGFFNSEEFKEKNVSESEFVTIMYEIFFDREPVEEDISYWGGEIRAGVSQNYIIHEITKSQEYADVCLRYGIDNGSYTLTEYRDKNAGLTKYVVRLYRTVLGREADVEGINGWCGCILNNIMTPEQAIESFLSSDEFSGRALDNSGYIRTLYMAFFGREASDQEILSWVQSIEEYGYTREQIAQIFVNSDEFKSVLSQYGLS